MAAEVSINRTDIKLKKQIGKGGFGVVFHAIWQNPSGNVNVAAKRLFEMEEHELEVLSPLRHPNIVGLLGVVRAEFDYMLILELCERGSLRSYLNKLEDQHLLPDLFHAWSKQAAWAIEYLQELDIIHKDVKSENYLITKDWVMKLADFGLAKKTKISLRNASQTGTAAYMAPELFTESNLSPTFDIFAFGVVLWELITRQIPFKGWEHHPIMYHVCIKKERLPIPDDCPSHLAELMEQCWLEDRHQRPSIKQILLVLGKTKKAIPVTQEQAQSAYTIQEELHLPLAMGPSKELAKCSSTKQLFLYDSGSSSDSKYSCESDEIGFWSYNKKFGHEEGPGKLTYATAVVVCPNGNMAIANLDPLPCIKVYDSAGGFKFALDTKQGLKPRQTSSPCGIAVSSRGIFFVCDGTQYVKVYDVNGIYDTSFATISPENKASNIEESVSLSGLTRDSKDNVLVGAYQRKYISKHTLDGAHLGSFKVLIEPYCLAVTHRDDVIITTGDQQWPTFIVDQVGHIIHILNIPNGIKTFPWMPFSICIGNDKIFITSTNADTRACIICYSLSGDDLGHIDITENVSRPMGIAMTSDSSKMIVTDMLAGVVVFCKM